MRNAIAVVCIIGVFSAGLVVTQAFVHPFLIDQANDVAAPFQGWVTGASPLGQEFTPTFFSLDVVELQMNSQSTSVGGSVFVQIRAGTIAGPILGTSLTVNIPPGTAINVAHFDFAAPVPLAPGAIHVIDIIGVTGSLGVFTAGGFGNNTYPGGAAIASGVIQQDDDLWFREGFSESLPVESVTWGTIKTLYRE